MRFEEKLGKWVNKYHSIEVAVITVYFFRVFGSTFHKYTKIYSILLGVHQPLLPKFVPVELPLPKVH